VGRPRVTFWESFERGDMRKISAALAVTVLGAAAILVGLAPASTAGPDYLSVVSSSAKAKQKNQARLSVTTKASIPRHPDAFIKSNPVVGFGWVDVATGKGFVVTIHPVIGRDSHQNPRGWHAHRVTLSGGATAPNDFCLASIDASPTAGISIHGKTMRVNVRTSKLPVAPSAFDVTTGFTVQHDTACTSGLAVRVST
jgi:hypothetical protein